MGRFPFAEATCHARQPRGSCLKNQDVKIGMTWTFNVTLMRNHQISVSCALVKGYVLSELQLFNGRKFVIDVPAYGRLYF